MYKRKKSNFYYFFSSFFIKKGDDYIKIGVLKFKNIKKKVGTLLAICLIVLSCVFVFPLQAAAGANDVLEGGSNGVEVIIGEDVDISVEGLIKSEGFRNIKDFLLTILQPVSVLGFSFVVFGLIVTQSQKTTENLLIWGKGILISFTIISTFNLILSAVSSIVSAHAYRF